MLLHHILAFLLIFGSYLINNINIGLLIMLLHDFGDIFLPLLRFYDKVENASVVV